MGYLKTLTSLAAAAAALMAFAATASATYVTTTTGGAAETPTIHAVNEGGHLSFHNPEWDIECGSTFEWTVESHGSGESAQGNVGNLSFTGCTGGWEVIVNSNGSLKVEYTGGHNGILTSTGMTMTETLNLIFFHLTCRYTTKNTSLGTVTGGNPATIHPETSLTFHSGSGACGTEPSAWTGNYSTTGALYVENTGGGN